MKIVIQRVLEAKVTVNNSTVAKIEAGVVVFIGITHKDTPLDGIWLAKKLIHLRIFEDDQGKINHSLLDHQGSVLIISQFTLYANCHEGRRPSFTQAAPPEMAKKLYEEFVAEVSKAGINTATGIFGAEMKVSLVNDGPMTIILEHPF